MRLLIFCILASVLLIFLYKRFGQSFIDGISKTLDDTEAEELSKESLKNVEVINDTENVFAEDEVWKDEYKPKENDNYVLRQSVDDVKISGDYEISSEMEMIHYIALRYPDENRIVFYEPVTIDKIEQFEERTGICLNKQMSELYMFSNGIKVSGKLLELVSLNHIESFLTREYFKEKYGELIENYIYVGQFFYEKYDLFVEKSSGSLYTYSDGKLNEMTDLKTIIRRTIETIYSNMNYEDEKIGIYLGRY